MPSRIFLAAFLLLPSFALAQGGAPTTGTVIIEQTGGIGPGKFGLIKPNDATPVESNSRSLTLENQQPGTYTLTITPPPGASFETTVTLDADVKKVSESRTVHEALTAGSTLTFSVQYVIDRVGSITVTFFNSRSESIAIPFRMSGPYGETFGATPATFENMPEGTYSVSYDLHAVGCPVNPATISRALRKRERLAFNSKSDCSALLVTAPEPGETPPSSEPQEEELPNVRVRLSADRSELLPGGGASVQIAVANTGNLPLTGLQADVRLDMGVVTVTGARGANVSNNQLVFDVPTLSPGERWQESFVVTAKKGVEIAAFPVTVSITGDSVVDIPTGNRQSSLTFTVVKILPASGVNLKLFYRLLMLGTATMIFGGAFGWRKIKAMYATR